MRGWLPMADMMLMPMWGYCSRDTHLSYFLRSGWLSVLS
jgi:hypothetical protein